MTPAEFRAALLSLGLTQSSFARKVGEIGGQPLVLRTVQAWALGERPIHALVPALLALLRERAAVVGFLQKYPQAS